MDGCSGACATQNALGRVDGRLQPPHLLGESPAKDPRAPELGPQYTNDLRLLLALLLQKAPDDRPTASDALAPGPPPGEGIVVGIGG